MEQIDVVVVAVSNVRGNPLMCHTSDRFFPTQNVV